MAVYDYDDDDVLDGDTDLPKKLRAVIKELKKENGDLAQKYEALQKEARTRSVQEQITSRGLNPKVAALIPQDADVDEWLNEYGDILGFAPANSADPAQEQVAAETRRMAEAEQGAVPMAGDLVNQIQNAENMDELMALLKVY